MHVFTLITIISLNFYHFHSIFVYPIYQHLRCSYVLNLSVSNRFLTTSLFQNILTFSRIVCFISTILGTYNLNTADKSL